MEILSPPKFVLQTWVDVAIGFGSGAVKEFTLRPTDLYNRLRDRIELVFVPCPGGPRVPETLTFHRQHIAWISEATRQVAVDPDTGLLVVMPKEAA